MTASLPLALLQQWVEQQLACAETPWQRGHQGQLLRYQEDGWDLVIKCPYPSGWQSYWSRLSLRREYRAYQRLRQLQGVPRCYGLLPGDFLVLESIAAVPYRQAAIPKREQWFQDLLGIIQGMHECGVAHGDLKRKANLLVTDEGRAIVVDFGTAWLRRNGWAPVNGWIFRYLVRTDLNAYVKHKYRGHYDQAQGEDSELLKYSRLERWISRWRKWRERRRLKRSA